MKKFISFLIIVCTCCICFAEDMTPRNSLLRYNSGYHPLTRLSLAYRVMLEVSADAHCYVYDGTEVIAQAEIVADNFLNECTIEVVFSEPFFPPVGKTYDVVIPEGAFRQLSDNSIANGEIREKLTVPSDLKPVFVGTNRSDKKIEYLSDINFVFDTEILSTENAQLDVYSDGVFLKSFTLYSSWDWDLGNARVAHGEDMLLEPDKSYTVIIPAGTLKAIERDDICNDEIRFDVVNQQSGIAEEKIGKISFVVSDGILQVSGAIPETAVSVYATDGRLLLMTVADAGGNASAMLERSGVYIVAVGGARHKIMVK